MEIVVVGHLSRDLLITPDTKRESLGGGTAYVMIAPSIGAFGAGIVTRVGSNFEQEYVDSLKSAGIDLSGFRTSDSYTTRFVNKYDKDGNRTQRIEATASEIRAPDLLTQHLEANIVHFCPLLNEIHPSAIEAARSFGALVSLDVQGFTRKLVGKKVKKKTWDNSDDILRYVDVVKCNEQELEMVVGMKSEVSAVTHILSLGPRIVLVTKGQKGSTVHTRNSHVDIPTVISEKLVDQTGCGDTLTIGFLLEYMRTGDVKRAGLFGATCASFNLENVGPYNFPTRNQVENRMKKYL
ncbi:MAG: carbohydrate kinase family protein [Candidatus Thorarchaeota archaeon]